VETCLSSAIACLIIDTDAHSYNEVMMAPTAKSDPHPITATNKLDISNRIVAGAQPNGPHVGVAGAEFE
jgi:hypothetical protein